MNGSIINRIGSIEEFKDTNTFTYDYSGNLASDNNEVIKSMDKCEIHKMTFIKSKAQVTHQIGQGYFEVNGRTARIYKLEKIENVKDEKE